MALGSPVWHGRATAAPARFALISLATLSSPSCLREVTTTRAPSAANACAMPAPIPRLPPVTKASLPFNRSLMAATVAERMRERRGRLAFLGGRLALLDVV